jgi:hypothetical protein
MGGEVDKLLSEFGKHEKVVKKAVVELKKKPGDKKLVDAIRNGMTELKKIRERYPAAVAADQKYMDKALSEITLSGKK